VIIDAGIYRDGRRIGGKLSVEDVAAHCRETGYFGWIGLSEPSVEDARTALSAIGLPTRFAEELSHHQNRSAIEINDHALMMSMRTARYVDPDRVEFGQVGVVVGDFGLVVVRLGEVNDLRPLRKSLEDDPSVLALGPKKVLAEIVGLVLDSYPVVLDGIAEDINEVEEHVFSADKQDPIRRIYELNREVLSLRRAIGPLTDAIGHLADESRSRLGAQQARWFRDLVDEANRTSQSVDASDALLTNILTANLTQVSLRQNEDMRKISAWAAILALPTAIAGIYGMNFEHMPEIEQIWGYPAVLTFMAVSCFALYRKFKSVGWL
jgi:magnesium transporter